MKQLYKCNKSRLVIMLLLLFALDLSIVQAKEETTMEILDTCYELKPEVGKALFLEKNI